MKLFNDTELFATGLGGKKTFDLPDTELILIDNFFSKEESDHYYEMLLHKTKWREYEMEIFDKTVTAPRMIAWYEDKDNPGADQNGPDWTYELLTIRSRVEKETQVDFNSVLLNLYRNGKDGVAWHSDKEHNTGPNPIIASVTFGETRMFRLRHKFRKEIPQVEIPLHHGSFLLMAGTTNSFWQHQVPKTARNVLPRINLTFRNVDRKE
ncbi:MULTISPECIES: alpha-ketoglutarate-dependent dioxygenase AlkB family protein [Flavobacterium]|uniref:Alpha-ketoglutarate-dependent dioxygenase AlkB n=2 Tax=Flavobacterium TaxID=237 RepID=A0A940XAG2_9FLAO|nr:MULTISPECIES: alpha-ketoglutarate-dependent dioxygenase AlkB [Flavobacterium]MBP4138877.1 alpha-ketoglutarate-dependent dioxygenase AlkB [Flavobacterium geliluteum]MDX6182067.1 alpha-ketoglutarate-dependent dioxygenase AlkB [Flavobacterium sp. Fl-33]MDX6186878.1 alpha-ketoglutarate-dependent dioxygenase AlkB [Flavobacterium sp. Fl-77]UFH37013.1 alpha-ketoglutarate-dependent dioxygenase AlkB [Flavobacterium sp. F-70]